MKELRSILTRIVPIILIITFLAGLSAFACASPVQAPATPTTPSTPATPTTPTTPSAPHVPTGEGAPSVPTTPPPPAPAPSGLPWQKDALENLGFAVGGAKDINNFRENIRNNYLPLPTDITYEGLFYEYYFDTGDAGPCRELFCPSYSYAVTRDPFSRKTDYYLSVGLNSGMKESDFERRKLNLVIVLDISGSMSSPFDQYYYDAYGNVVELGWKESNMQKIEVAKDAVMAILDQLNDDDRFGIVLFNSRAHLLQPIRLVRRTDWDEVEDSIYEIRASGSTNLSDGMHLATELFEDYDDIDPDTHENRIIFLTDAMPNNGEISSYSLLRLLKRNAKDYLYTTFIGVGVDFNTQIIEDITKTRGANYYSVHSPGDFMDRVEEEFDYMVTPLVFNLRLTLDSKGWDIEEVYGSPEADRSTGELMKVNTLFPSKTEEGETRGGLILLKLDKEREKGGFLRLSVSYEDREGRKETSEAMVYLEDARPEYFDNSGIRKGVLLSRYADLVKNWLIDEESHAAWSRPWEPCINYETGIEVPPSSWSPWERQSLPLMVSPQYSELFEEFADYFAYEMDEIGDFTLEQELDILDFLADGFRD